MQNKIWVEPTCTNWVEPILGGLNQSKRVEPMFQPIFFGLQGSPLPSSPSPPLPPTLPPLPLPPPGVTLVSSKRLLGSELPPPSFLLPPSLRSEDPDPHGPGVRGDGAGPHPAVPPRAAGVALDARLAPLRAAGKSWGVCVKGFLALLFMELGSGKPSCSKELCVTSFSYCRCLV